MDREMAIFRQVVGLVCVLLAFQFQSNAQSEKDIIREGNAYYAEGDYENAAYKYTEAELIDRTDKATFNKGNSLLRSEKVEDAISLYQNLNPADKMELAKTKHNLGNAYMKAQKLDEAIEAYKEALRANPKSNESRYNLSVALKLKNQQPPQEQNQEQKQDQNQDQKKEEQEQQQEQKEEQQDEQQKEEEQQQQEQPQPENKEQVENMLNALQEQEKKAQEKMQKAKMKAVKVKIEKDW